MFVESRRAFLLRGFGTASAVLSFQLVFAPRKSRVVFPKGIMAPSIHSWMDHASRHSSSRIHHHRRAVNIRQPWQTWRPHHGLGPQRRRPSVHTSYSARATYLPTSDRDPRSTPAVDIEVLGSLAQQCIRGKLVAVACPNRPAYPICVRHACRGARVAGWVG